MTKSISAEELINQTLIDICACHDTEGLFEPEFAKEVITQAIKQATEPLYQALERTNEQMLSANTALENSNNVMERAESHIKNLESQNALLVEALQLVEIQSQAANDNDHHDSWASPHIEGECDACFYDGLEKICAEALTNTAQAAKERDERIKAEGFNEGVQASLTAIGRTVNVDHEDLAIVIRQVKFSTKKEVV